MAPHALVFLLCAAAVGASFRSDVQQPRASNGAVAADEFDADSPSWLDDAANESWPSPLVAPAVERVPSASASYTGARASSEMYSPESTWLPRSDGVGGGDDEAAAVGEVEAEWAQTSWLPQPTTADVWVEDVQIEAEAGSDADDAHRRRSGGGGEEEEEEVDEEVETLIAEANRARMLQLTATRTRTRT